MLSASSYLLFIVLTGSAFFHLERKIVFEVSGYLVLPSDARDKSTPSCRNLQTDGGLISSVVVLNETGTVSRVDAWQWNCTYASSNHPLTLRVAVDGDADKLAPDSPILVVIRQKTQVLSWQVPFVANDTSFYWQTERTLCPENIQSSKRKDNGSEDTIVITLSTSSNEDQNFRVVAYFLGSRLAVPRYLGEANTENPVSNPSAVEQNLGNITAQEFEMEVGVPFHFQASPSMPQFFYFQIPDDSDKIILRMESTNDVCAILSVQPALCPVGDLVEGVKYRGYFQTVMSHGAITVSKIAFNMSRYFAVLVVMPDDYECVIKSRSEPLPLPKNTTSVLAAIGRHQSQHQIMNLRLRQNEGVEGQGYHRMKDVTFTLVQTISYANYLLAIFAPIGVLAAIVLLSLLVQCTNMCRYFQINPIDAKEALDKNTRCDTMDIRNAVFGNTNSGPSGGYYGSMPVGSTSGRYMSRQQRARGASVMSEQNVFNISNIYEPVSTSSPEDPLPIVTTRSTTPASVADPNAPAVISVNENNCNTAGIVDDADGFNNTSKDDHYASMQTLSSLAHPTDVNKLPSRTPSLHRPSVPPPPATSSRIHPSSNGPKQKSLRLRNVSTNSRVTFPHYVDGQNGHSNSGSSEDDLEMHRQVDFVPDYLDERDVIRAKNELTLADLTKKGIAQLRSKDRQYPMSLITVVIFYCLPVAQLVVAYQLQLQTTGDEDLCFYNFDCARPWYIFSDFNHIVSNSGYMILGILFCIIVGIRDRRFRLEMRLMDENEDCRSKQSRTAAVRSTPLKTDNTDAAVRGDGADMNGNPSYHEQISGPHDLVEAVTQPRFTRSASQRWEDERGIPPQFGILYSMGIALIVEGIMSACYHVCPNRSNFQFDSAFMYLIAGLGILRLYQCRHPDIHPQAYVAYLIYAVIISIAVAGVLIDLPGIWIAFCVLLISFSVFIALQLYFLGMWSLEKSTFHNLYVRLRGGSFTYRYCMPSRPVSFLLGLAIVILNSFFGLLGALKAPNDFATFLLTVLLSNGTMYLVYYCIMKWTVKESISAATVAFAVLALVTWIGSLYLFLYPLTNSMRTAAQSRQGNKACFVLDFYDEHDAWHFLSSLAVYLSFLVFLTIDDDLKFTPRDKIIVF